MKLEKGMKIRFSVVPVGSYCSVGVVYLIEHIGKHDVTLHNIEKGSGTFDPIWAVKASRFEVI